VVKGFTRRRVESLRETMERTVSALLDDYEKAGGGDLMEAVAFPLPVTVIGEMLTSENGLGYYILLEGRAFHSANLFAGVILLGLIGLFSNLALQAAEARLLRWRRR